MNIFQRWTRRNEKKLKLRPLVENFYNDIGIQVKNIEVRVAVEKEYVPMAIGTGGSTAQDLKEKLDCSFLKVVPAFEPGHSPEYTEEGASEYGGFYRERRINEHKEWTEEEEQKLIYLRKNRMSTGDIAKALDRTPFSIFCRLKTLRLSGNNPGSFNK